MSHAHLVFHAEHALQMTIDGENVPQVSGSTRLWQWYTHRKAGQHVLVIEREDDVQVVNIECVDASVHERFVDILRDTLNGIDVRLSVGQSAWQSAGIQIQLFEQYLGMSLDTFLDMLLRMVQSVPSQVLREWQGDTSAQIRIDRIVLRDASVVPLVNQSIQHHNHEDVILLLRDIVERLAACNTGLHTEQLHAIRQRLRSPVQLSRELVQLVTHAHRGLSASLRSGIDDELQQTADVALLYERWVWVTVLLALGCDVKLIPRLIDGDRVYENASGVFCAYQRRISPTKSLTGWSRDGRVAVPDVMLWQLGDVNACRALIIDAKCSLQTRLPDGSAINDVTAYLRRIGVGDADPDAAVLVHPGIGRQQWPSGLIVVGTQGIDAQALSSVVRMWVDGAV